MEYAKYTVLPFSGQRYLENSERCKDDETPCVICGKPVAGEWKHAAVVTDGGVAWGNEDSDQEDPGYMGAWPVGNDCHRKYRSA